MGNPDPNNQLKHYHVVALKVGAENRKAQSHKIWKTIEYVGWDEKFSFGPANGIVPLWPEKTYLARLQSILAHDHTNKRKHCDASDLGA